MVDRGTMYIDDPTKYPADIGEKVIVFGAVTEQFRPIVSYMEWLPKESRWFVELLWESGETSKVYSSDKGKYWITEREYKPVVLN